MKIGKLPEELLEKIILKSIKFHRNDVISRSGVGEDTAIIDPESNYIALSCDPITGTTKNIGKLAVHINCNDLVTSGARPMALMVCLLFPPSITEKEIENVMDEITKESEKIGVEIIGGHTEISNAVTRPLAIVTVIGKVKRNQLLQRNQIKPGDFIVMSKVGGLEGTGIIIHEKEHELKEILSENEICGAKDLFKDLSVIEEGLSATNYHVRYMHDITEGGVLGACWELGKALNCGITIYKNKIPLKKETLKISEFYNINPLKLISSGSMLFVFSPDDYKKFKNEMDGKGIKISVIGKIREDNQRIVKGEFRELLEAPVSDELYKVL